MAGFARKKRVTNLFDDDARARLVGKLSSVSSESQHSGNGDGDGDGDITSLSALVHGFLENHDDDDNDKDDDSVSNELDSERVKSVDDYDADSVGDNNTLRRRSVSVAFGNNVDPYRNTLLANVSEAVEKFAFLRETRNVSLFRRSVVAFLKEKGHDVAVCKTTWNSGTGEGGVTAGSHEFIDIVQSGSSTWRYFLDLDFRAQFEIARPTRRFSEVLESLVPVVFVGRAEELKRTVSMVCDAAKRSFKSRGLSVPPWRKNRFMQNKWFAPCRRVADPVRENPVPAVVTAVNSVSCKLVGFDDVVFEGRRGGGVAVCTR